MTATRGGSRGRGYCLLKLTRIRYRTAVGRTRRMIRHRTIAAVEAALRMRCCIVILMVVLRLLIVVRIVTMLYVMHLVAVLMVMNISGHIRMVVAIMPRSTMVVMRWEMAVIIGRYPYRIIMTAVIVKNQRSAYKYRLDDIVRSINIGMTDNLYIRRSAIILHYDGGYILIDIPC